MKQYSIVAVLAIFGSIMVGSGMMHQEASATEIDGVLSKMIEIDNKLTNLKDSDSEFSKSKLAKASFEINQVKEILLEINDVNDKNGDTVNKIYDHLKKEYHAVIEKYQKQIKEYQKENGLTANEKRIASKILKSQINFKNVESEHNQKLEIKNKVSKTITETQAKENYQKLVNKIGEKLADKANGGIVQKIHHKVAIEEISESKSWGLAIPAIDRIITQSSDDKVKEKLTNIKSNIQATLDKKEKQEKSSPMLGLKNEKSESVLDSIRFNQNEIGFGGILGEIYDNEILESLKDTEEIVFEIEQNSLDTINPIIEDELKKTLIEVTEIVIEEEEEVEKEKEKQRKNAAEKKGNNRSDKAKEVLSNNPGKSSSNSSNGNSSSSNSSDNSNSNSNSNSKGKNNK